MSRKPNKKTAILEYAKNNPMATPSEVAKACGTHKNYTYLTMRNANAKKPKQTQKEKSDKPDFVFKPKEFSNLLILQINELREENDSLRDDIIRLCGVVEYLEAKLTNGASV